MCGSLKLENQMLTRLNGSIPSTNISGAQEEYSCSKYRFSGWARIDGKRDKSKTFSEQWPRSKNQVVTITNVEYFTERSRTLDKEVQFQIPGKQIAAIVDKHGELRILTRPSRPGAEKEVHHRMPVTVENSMGREGFIKFLNDRLGTDYE